MIKSLKANKRPKGKMYGSYKAYDNSKDKERDERRIYQYAEASEEHLRRIRKTIRQHSKALLHKKVAVLTASVMLAGAAMFAMFY